MKATQNLQKISIEGVKALAAVIIRGARLSEAKTAVLTARELLNGVLSDDEFVAWVKEILSK